MKHLVNIPLSFDKVQEYNKLSFLQEAKCQGYEVIWSGLDEDVECENIIGWHLTFFTDWIDFWREDKEKLNIKYGNQENWQGFYGGKDRESLLKFYRDDFIRAEKSKAEYGVFHICDCSMEEWFTDKPLHSEEEIISEAIGFINEILKDQHFTFKLLLENMPINGLTMKNKDMIYRLMEGINYDNLGIMMDTGHIMAGNPKLKDEKEGIEYLNLVLDNLGDAIKYIEGIHLSKSICYEYVSSIKSQEIILPENIYDRFAFTTNYVMELDRHQPWECREISKIIERINPKYIVHEIRGKTSLDKLSKIKLQQKALEK